MNGNPPNNPLPPNNAASGQSQPPATAAEVDLSGFNEVAGGDEQEERDLMELYAGQLDQKLPHLKAAVEAGDGMQIKLIAHSLAGSSSTCGLLAFAETLRELEQRGAKQDAEAARTLFAQAAIQAQQTKTAILRKLGR
jgi:HPt (histidine-containing phosphotransfer) domain-containing protein